MSRSIFKIGLPVFLSILLFSGCSQANTSTTEPSHENIPKDTSPPIIEAATPETFNIRVRAMDGMVMIYVPAGSFLMGSSDEELEMAYDQCDQEVKRSDCPPGRFDDEAPQHAVTLDAFWIDQTEVTNGHYQECIDAGGCEPWDCYPPGSEMGGAKYPAYCVNWYEAQKYCEWAGARLPTEAEWEYAARGPNSQIYPWGNQFDGTRLNFCDITCYNRWRNPHYDDGYNGRAPVGSYLDGASWCGALDMAGNVAELVADWYLSDYYASSPGHNPLGPITGKFVVFKGGASNHVASYVRSAWRASMPPHGYYGAVGFRCAVSDSNPQPSQVVSDKRN